MSAFREWLEEQFGLGSERDAFLTAVEDCHNAKTNLENIPYKKPCEVFVINEAKYVLKGSEINLANLSSEKLTKYTERLEEVTRKMNAHYDTYNAYKNHNTDYVLRRLFGVTNCCCGSRNNH